jgi:hypothetical protein
LLILAFSIELTHCVLLLLGAQSEFLVENLGEKALFSEVGGPLISSANPLTADLEGTSGIVV